MYIYIYIPLTQLHIDVCAYIYREIFIHIGGARDRDAPRRHGLKRRDDVPRAAAAHVRGEPAGGYSQGYSKGYSLGYSWG